jgi:CelD/BcsL family acetyltransferase involved in cellulose biosynthesis
MSYLKAAAMAVIAVTFLFTSAPEGFTPSTAFADGGAEKAYKPAKKSARQKKKKHKLSSRGSAKNTAKAKEKRRKKALRKAKRRLKNYQKKLKNAQKYYKRMAKIVKAKEKQIQTGGLEFDSNAKAKKWLDDLKDDRRSRDYYKGRIPIYKKKVKKYQARVKMLRR